MIPSYIAKLYLNTWKPFDVVIDENSMQNYDHFDSFIKARIKIECGSKVFITEDLNLFICSDIQEKDIMIFEIGLWKTYDDDISKYESLVDFTKWVDSTFHKKLITTEYSKINIVSL